MSLLGRLLAPIRDQWIPPSEVKAEAWALGRRHQGRVLEGAWAELSATNVPVRRTVLLKAVIRDLDERSAPKKIVSPQSPSMADGRGGE